MYAAVHVGHAVRAVVENLLEAAPHLVEVAGERNTREGVRVTRVEITREGHHADPRGSWVELVDHRLHRCDLGCQDAVSAVRVPEREGSTEDREPLAASAGSDFSVSVHVGARGSGGTVGGIDHEHDVEGLELAEERERAARDEGVAAGVADDGPGLRGVDFEQQPGRLAARRLLGLRGGRAEDQDRCEERPAPVSRPHPISSGPSSGSRAAGPGIPMPARRECIPGSGSVTCCCS